MNQITGSSFSLTAPQNVAVFHLERRNAQAEAVIRDYARGHAFADVGIGLLGTLIPGSAIPAMIASIALQAPLVYQPMAKQLAAIYSTEPDMVTQDMVIKAAIVGGVGDLAAEVAGEFLSEIAKELITDAGISAAGTMIPVIGGVIAAGLDAAVAATLTWRVGTMIAIYHQNRSSWIGSRSRTYHRAKDMVGGLSPATDNRVNLIDIPRKNPEVLSEQMKVVRPIIEMLRSVGSGREQMRAALSSQGIPSFIIDHALKEARL